MHSKQESNSPEAVHRAEPWHWLVSATETKIIATSFCAISIHGIQNARRNVWTEIVQRNILKWLGLTITISETFSAWRAQQQSVTSACFSSLRGTRMEVFVAETKRWKTKAGSGTLIPVFFQRKFGERTQKVQTCFNYYSWEREGLSGKKSCIPNKNQTHLRLCIGLNHGTGCCQRQSNPQRELKRLLGVRNRD